jgi:hypothetical protein
MHMNIPDVEYAAYKSSSEVEVRIFSIHRRLCMYIHY